MKRLLTALLLTATLSAEAQTGILYTRQAKGEDGKLLSNKDLFVDRSVYPRGAYASWTGDGNILYYDSGWKEGRIDGNKIESKAYVPKQHAKPERIPLSENVTPHGDKVAFTSGHSLYVRSEGGEVRPVALSEDDDITYGQTVSRNEFGIEGGIFWAPDGSKLAFYRKDESKVTDFPLLDITTRTGSLKSIKYPMNGMDSERVSLGVFDFASCETVYMDVRDFGEDRYLTNVSWSPDASTIYIQVVDREQHHMHLNSYNAADGSFIKTLLTEENDVWIEPLDPIDFIKGRDDVFIYRTDNRDGWRNLYLVNIRGDIRRLTTVDADVAYVGNDGKSVFYTSAEVSPVENHLFRIDMDIPVAVIEKTLPNTVYKANFSKPVRLTAERGSHEVSFNDDWSRFIDSYSALDVPSVTKVKDRDGKTLATVGEAPDPLDGYAQCEIDFGTVKSADGKFDNYYRLIKPRGFDPSKKYPLIVYVYGGPHSQLVTDSWLGGAGLWEMLMAEKGYLVYVQDNRGTQNRGAAFEKSINRRCGQNEMADQMEGIKMLSKEPWVDTGRIGVHGWSYGGFMTISLITNFPETFKVAVAGGPVIDWKWYEIMYGERYMDNPETNPEGFAETSLIAKAKDLKGKLLICQGAIDNTVVWEHSLSFVEECIRNFVQLDYFPYPTTEHNVRVPWRAHLMDKVTMYFEDYL